MISAPENAIFSKDPTLVATYSVHFSATTSIYHYDARLLEYGRAIDYKSGCSIGPMAFGYNRASATRQAKRAARKLLRDHLRTRSEPTLTGTITPEEIA